MRNNSSRTLRAYVSVAGMALFGVTALGLATTSGPFGGGINNGGDSSNGSSSGMPSLGGSNSGSGSDSVMDNGMGNVEMPKMNFSAYSVPTSRDDDECGSYGGKHRYPFGNIFQSDCQTKNNSFFKGNVEGKDYNGGRRHHRNH